MNLPNYLQDDLRTAMAIELTTLPTYLYSYWSIKTVAQGGSQAGVEAAEIILSVINEEMLHMGLVSNILNALGGTPTITTPPYIPQYPGELLRHVTNPPKENLIAHLYPLSLPAIDLFLQIELPEYDDPGDPTTRDWKTIGQFYHGLEHVLKETPELDYSHGRQLPKWDNPGVGTLLPVTSQADAIHAIDEIVEQGEGASEKNHDDGEHELAHFWKFNEVKENMVGGLINLDEDVFPMMPDPDATKYTPAQKAANVAFNSAYSSLLDALQTTFTSDSPDVFGAATGYMDQLRQLTAVLRQQGNVPGTHYVVGPTFEYIPANQRKE